MAQGYFVTGTDTGVGKTLVASALVSAFASSGVKVVGMKPVAAGCQLVDGVMLNEDVQQLMAAANVAAPLSLVNPYALMPAIAPHIAAEQAGMHIQLAPVLQAYAALAALADVVIVEGAGGFCVPLGPALDMAQLAQALALPVVLVVGMRLGCINHALLTQQAIQASGLPLAGWVANCLEPDMPVLQDNLQALRQRLDAPCLGVVPYLHPADSAQAALTLQDFCRESSGR